MINGNKEWHCNTFTHDLPKRLVLQCQKLLHIRNNMFYKIVDILPVEKSVDFFLPKWWQYIGMFIRVYTQHHNEINGVWLMGKFDVPHITLHVVCFLGAYDKYIQEIYDDINYVAECDRRLFGKMVKRQKPKQSKIYTEIIINESVSNTPETISP